jgi:hypothetical protein
MKVNLTNVRPATGRRLVVAAIAAGVVACGGAAPAQARPPVVTLALVPRTTLVQRLADTGFSVGLLSAGIGNVPAEETYRDISAGNREPPPSDAVPGLLQSTLSRAGLSDSLRKVQVAPDDLSRLVARLRGGDLLIALGKPPPPNDRALPIGIAGAGFDGTLTSDSTRTSGYVLSTDLAPTILHRLGVSIPDEMDGEPIRAKGDIDPGAVIELGDRMTAVADRRIRELTICIAVWLLAALAIGRKPARRRAAAAWLGLAFAYLPLLLLAGAAIEPKYADVEGLLVAGGAAALGALTLIVVGGWWAAAVACGVTVIAYAIDMLTGSELTRLSLLGPDPIYGARFYGIGNELEALFAVMVPVGVGAGLSAWRKSGKPLNERVAVLAFVVAGLLAAALFAVGRFGADVGAAIVLPVGAVVAALSVPVVDFSGYEPGKSTRAPRRRVVAALVCLPFIAVASLAVIDLASGANAHLTRSVLDAGGANDLADLAERRLRLSAHDFAQAAANPLFWMVVVGIVLAIARWRRIDAWLTPAPIARAGLIGACAAVAAGVLVNDSGATFLVLGGLALGAFLAYAWAQTGEIGGSRRNSGAERV